MNIDKVFTSKNIKLFLIAIASSIALFWIMTLILISLFTTGFYKAATAFNHNFESMQKEIHDQIISGNVAAKKRSEELDKMSSEFHSMVDNNMKQTFEFLARPSSQNEDKTFHQLKPMDSNILTEVDPKHRLTAFHDDEDEENDLREALQIVKKKREERETARRNKQNGHAVK